MNTKEKIINEYKKISDLLVKRNLLHLLNTKYLNIGLSDTDYITENILNNIISSNGGRLTSDLIMRYGRNYNNMIYEFKNK